MVLQLCNNVDYAFLWWKTLYLFCKIQIYDEQRIKGLTKEIYIVANVCNAAPDLDFEFASPN